ncbi:MAG: hypothetical protein V1733_11425 [bacterium]
MTKITFSEKELEQIRSYYEAELLAADDYVKGIKEILAKLRPDQEKKAAPIGAAAGAKVKPAKETGKKRGRPSKAKTEEPTKTEEPKPKEKRGRKRKVAVKKVTPEIQPAVMVEMAKAAPEKKAVTSTKRKKRPRISGYRQKGVYLTNLSKPLPRKPAEVNQIPEEPITPEAVPEVSTETT